MKKLSVIIVLLLSVLFVKGQIVNPTSWTFDSKQNGNEVELIFKASIEDGWHLYDTYLPEGGPIATAFVFDDSTKFEFIGDIQKNPEPVKVFDETFQMNVGYFSHEATLTQKIKLLTDNEIEIKGYVLFMSCNDETCTPPNETEFSFTFNKGKTSGETGLSPTSNEEITTSSTSGSASGQTIWLFILISALAGLAAILTPCVFPMIPMTVSFFMRGSENRSKAIRTGFFFGFSIVLIFTLLGALFSFGIFGPNVGSILSTHWIPNILFFILFLVFAISFFGAFEIVLPSSLVNKTDSQADKGGLIGAFFMALTTVIVSFSCTGPFIGALIIQAVQDGGMRPLIGMFFFGLAFATPFTLLAIFPSALSKLPKSGGWLNAIKVVFAFILLAFGLKFVSNIDQVYGLGILSREIYLAIWIVVFSILGMYFLGKIKFSHDSDLPYVSVGRLFLSIATFTFVIYLFTGLLGNPLSSISSLIPPASTNTYLTQNTSSNGVHSSSTEELCGPAKYADKLHLPHGLPGYFDYEQGLACAQEQGKPAFVVFKGHACANCKKMENSVWADPEALQILSEKYVIIGLYTDDRTKLPEDEWTSSEVDGKVKKTMGQKNLDLLISKYGTNTIPYHAIVEPDGTEYTMSVTFDDEEFKTFLEKGI
ncbi:protein-disulfide reductase DsbD family protein [Maribellus maritimus]|uniref:protein-disulfide reductase DsbD family protein n=1 Tax=Maribellus maritimus TaxID=2870838 RepID=UPI001EEA9C4B|nr:cytochrome c biogenesis protein CcdA [Maribellus maritimus]MCG6190699.1 thioredoxin family protein [Maribellus maritimus]